MNKSFKMIFVALAILTLSFLFVGCNSQHTHEFNEMVATDNFLSKPATCAQQASYFYSCKCGKKGKETFRDGKTLEHNFVLEKVESKYLNKPATCNSVASYFYSCECGAIGTDTFETGGFGDHDFTKKQVAPDFLETSATCLQKATYVYSCACGLKGTDTFEAGAIGDHNFVDNQPCTVCHASYGLKYEMAQDNSGYEVSIGDCTDRHIVIPMYYNSLLVTKIANNGFQRCTSLLSVTFSDGIKTIGNHAFASCRGLTSVTIPASVRKIGDFAFNACYRLVEVINKSHYFTIAKGGTDNGRIGEYALSVFNARDIVNSQLSYDNDFVVFTDGEQKILVGYNGTATNWVIPSYVTAINRYVFHSCKDVKSIIIPKSVTSVGEYAFKGCSSLSEVYYTGTMGGWSGIDIADENGSLTGAKTYYYSKNEPTDDGNYWHYDTDETTPVVW